MKMMYFKSSLVTFSLFIFEFSRFSVKYPGNYLGSLEVAPVMVESRSLAQF